MLDRSRLSMVLFFVLSCLSLGGAPPSLPETPRKPVADVYHGVKILDPYRWLENRKDPAVKKWVDQQNRFTRAHLDKLPTRKAILARLNDLAETDSIHCDKMTFHDGKLFGRQAETLVTLKSADDPATEKMVVDPVAALGKATASLDFYEVSPNGKTMAVSMSSEGKDIGSVYFFDIASGKKLPDVIPNVKSPLGGDMTWKADNSGIYYTRNPTDEPGEKAEPARQLIFFHPLGKDPKNDPYVFGKELSAIAGSNLIMSKDGKYLLIGSSIGWAPEHSTVYLIDVATGKAQRVGAAEDKITFAQFGKRGELFLLSNRDAPRGKILSIPRDERDLKKAKTIVPLCDGVLDGFTVLDKGILALERIGTASRLRLFDGAGKELASVPVPAGMHVSEVVPLEKDELLFLAESFFTPAAWFHFKLGAPSARKTKLRTSHPRIDCSDCEMVREQATSKDGTKIPITILRRKDIKLAGTNPVLLTGYGGYNFIQTAEFNWSRRLWLEHGGVIAIAHLRGDGNFGEDWYRAGLGAKRQNAFDDFAACAKHLIDRKYTKPAKLAIEGGSNGGTLVGVALTQQPKLFRAAIAHAGVYDMLRQELQARGADIQEFGTVKNLAEFKALHAYSPYHKVMDGTAYPAVLMTAGENDGRVDAADTWRFAARLQAAGSKQSILLWTRTDAGHQVDSTEGKADVYLFLFEQLELAFNAIK
jgi:prolyl oligopeptidase